MTDRLAYTTNVTKHKFLTPDKLLTRVQLARLSRPAQRLFAGVYDRCEYANRYGQDCVWLDNEDLQRRANCRPDQIGLAINELLLAQLLVVRREAVRACYELGTEFVKPQD